MGDALASNPILFLVALDAFNVGTLLYCMTIYNRTSILIRDLIQELSAVAALNATYPSILGHCPMCGEWGTFVVSSPVLRESLVCNNCFSTSRYRSLALGVLRSFGELTGVVAPSIAELPLEASTNLRVLDTQPGFDFPPISRYMLPTMLERCSWVDVHTSSYRPHIPWGEPLGGTTTNQNLENLTYPADYFDLVITSDVMEHVRLYERAHAEIARVLKPGGHYVFTVPHGRNMHDHLLRIKIHDPEDAASDEMVLPAEYHGSANPEEGPVISFRVFGTKLDDELSELGFDVNYQCVPMPEKAIFDTELFFCRKTRGSE